MYVFSTPSALTLRIIVPIFLVIFGFSMTAIKFLQRKGLIASARLRMRVFFFFSLSSMTLAVIK